MKQYRPLLFIVITLLIGWTILIQEACGQQLKQIQKGTANNQIPVTNGYQNTQVYRNAIPYILDTLGIRDSLADDQTLTLLDSINRVFRLQISDGNTVKWRAGLLVETDGSTVNELTDFYENNPPPPSAWKKGDLWYAPSIGTLYISTGGVPSLVWKQSDWNETDTELQSYIKNKPDIGDMIHDSLSTVSGETQYLNPYVITGDTVGFYLTVAQDTVLFQNTIDTASYCCPPSIGNDTLYIGDNYVVLPKENIIGGWGITATESPDYTWNIIADSSQVATQYDLSLVSGSQTLSIDSTNRVFTVSISGGNSVKFKDTGGVDSTTVVNSYGTTITESPANQFNIKVDSSKFATVYDLTQVSGSSSKVIDILGSDFTTSATSLQTTDLAYTFPSTGTYEVKLYGQYTSSNTLNGITYGYVASGGLTASFVTGSHYIYDRGTSASGSTSTIRGVSALGNAIATSSVNSADSPLTIMSEILVTVSATGTLTFNFASESGSYSATLVSGSSLIIEKLN